MRKFFIICALMSLSLYGMEKEVKIRTENGAHYWIASLQAVQLSEVLKNQINFYENSSEIILPDAISIKDFDMFVPYLGEYAASQDSLQTSKAFVQGLETLCREEPAKFIKLAMVADALDTPLIDTIITVFTKVFSSSSSNVEHIRRYFEQESSPIDTSLKWEVQAPIVQALLKDHPALAYWLCRIQASTNLMGHEVAGHKDTVCSAVFSKQGSLLLTASKDRKACLWDASTLACKAILKGHTAGVGAACFNDQGTAIATASWDGTTRIWDLTGKCLSVIPVIKRPLPNSAYTHRIKFNGKGDKVLYVSRCIVTREPSGIVDYDCPSVWDPYTGKLLFRLTHKASNGFFNEHDTRIITHESNSNQIHIWSASDGSLVSTINLPSPIKKFVPCKDSTLIVTQEDERSSSTVKVFNTDDGSYVPLPINGADEGYARSGSKEIHMLISNQGNKIAIAGVSMSNVHIFNTNDYSCHLLLPGHVNGVYALAFSQDDTLLVTLSYDMVPRIWDLRSGKCILILKRPIWVFPKACTGVMFNKDASSIIATFVSEETEMVSLLAADSDPVVWNLFDPKMKDYLLNALSINQALLLIYAYECIMRNQPFNLYDRAWSKEELLQLDKNIFNALSETISLTDVSQLKSNNTHGDRCTIS